MIHEKSTRHHPLNEVPKKLNRIQSITRACVEHVFDCMSMSMGGKLSRKISLARNDAWLEMKNPTFNLFAFSSAVKPNKLWCEPQKEVTAIAKQAHAFSIALFADRLSERYLLFPKNLD